MSHSSVASMKDRKRAAAEQSLLDAAEAEFAAAGVAAASMLAIAARAGVSVGTLYNYFKDKDDLVIELLNGRRSELASRLDDAVTAPGSFEDHLRAMVHRVFVHFDEHRAFLRVSLHADLSVMKRRSATALLHDRISRLVEQGVREGFVRKRTAPLAVAAIGGIIRSILIERVESKDSFVAVVDDAVELMLHGIGR